MIISTAKDIRAMVESLLRNEPQSDFVYKVYPDVAVSVAASIARSETPIPHYEPESA